MWRAEQMSVLAASTGIAGGQGRNRFLSPTALSGAGDIHVDDD